MRFRKKEDGDHPAKVSAKQIVQEMRDAARDMRNSASKLDSTTDRLNNMIDEIAEEQAGG